MARETFEQLIAEQLRQAIERRQLTQARAAELLGTSTKHLNEVLRCKAHPSVKTLQQWSDALGIRWQVEAIDLAT